MDLVRIQLFAGNIPVGLGKLTSLTTLDLGNNTLAGKSVIFGIGLKLEFSAARAVIVSVASPVPPRLRNISSILVVYVRNKWVGLVTTIAVLHPERPRQNLVSRRFLTS